jgi:hypothetical protein
MKRIVFLLLLSAFWCNVQAANIDRTGLPGNSHPVKKYIIELPETINLKKFKYAEMVWQVSYMVEKIWVNGQSVSQEVKSKVAAAKYRDLALEVLGDDGWELTSTVTRNIDAGFEIFFYLKKSVE